MHYGFTDHELSIRRRIVALDRQERRERQLRRGFDVFLWVCGIVALVGIYR